MENKNYKCQLSEKVGEVLINSYGEDTKECVKNWQILKKHVIESKLEDTAEEIKKNSYTEKEEIVDEELPEEMESPFYSEGDMCPKCEKKGVTKTITKPTNENNPNRKYWKCPDCGFIAWADQKT